MSRFQYGRFTIKYRATHCFGDCDIEIISITPTPTDAQHEQIVQACFDKETNNDRD